MLRAWGKLLCVSPEIFSSTFKVLYELNVNQTSIVSKLILQFTITVKSDAKGFTDLETFEQGKASFSMRSGVQLVVYCFLQANACGIENRVVKYNDSTTYQVIWHVRPTLMGSGSYFSNRTLFYLFVFKFLFLCSFTASFSSFWDCYVFTDPDDTVMNLIIKHFYHALTHLLYCNTMIF